MRKARRGINKKILILLICFLIIGIIILFVGVFNVKQIEILVYDKSESLKTTQILDSTGIAFDTSIFKVNKKIVEENVRKYFGERNVKILNIERVFPNKIIIKLKEVQPIFSINAYDEDIYLADSKFTLNMKVEAEGSFNQYIPIIGYELTKEPSFNIFEFEIIKEAISILEEKWSDDAIKAIFSEIIIEKELIIFNTYKGDSLSLNKTTISREEMSNAVESFYNKYVSSYSKQIAA